MNRGRLRHPRVIGAAHPAVFEQRLREVSLTGFAGLVPAGIALAIILLTPNPSIRNAALVLGGIAAVLAVAALVASSRLEVTVTLLVLYLLLMYGPIKLGVGGGELAHGADDVLILAICLGGVMRLAVAKTPAKLPPLTGWVIAFVATGVIEAFNPKTAGILKALGGLRQQLQFVPFFFFGYLLVRSKKRFRQVFLIVGVCALANGIVATYQTRLSPVQLATWGPGYRALFQPTSIGKRGGQARVFDTEGEARPRPLGLGSDSGFSGGVGLIALPFCLALLATWRSRRRWVAAVLALGAIAGVAAGGGRAQLIGAALSVSAFVMLSAVVGGRVKRPMAALLTVLALALPLGVIFVSVAQNGAFDRFSSLESNSLGSIATHKAGGYTKIPEFLSHSPFGVGLGVAGGVAGFGGKSEEPGEIRGPNAETEYNLLADELGAPGLIVWALLSLYIVGLVLRRIPAVGDGQLAILLAGAFAPFIALIFIGFSGPTQTSTALGPLFWFTIGVAAYWLAGAKPRAFEAVEEPAR